MKEFYRTANRVLMIRTNNPVVRQLKMATENDEEILSDRVLVEEAIARYFKDIYKRPDHL
jgi:hypothetical protein